MPKQIQITIPEPCHEKWSEMTPVKEGFFCRSCQKNVIDFSNKTENEIYEIINRSEGKMCGRFTTHQLQNPVRKTELHNSLFNWRAIAASIGALVATEKLSAYADTGAKPKVVAKEVKQISLKKEQEKCADTIAMVRPTVIKGQVIDKQTREGLDGAILKYHNVNRGYVTDTAGYFTVNYEDIKPDTITFSYIGYRTLTVPVAELIKANDQGKVALEEMVVTVYGGMQPVMMGGVISVRRGSRVKWAFHRFANKIKYAFRKKD